MLAGVLVVVAAARTFRRQICVNRNDDGEAPLGRLLVACCLLLAAGYCWAILA